MNCSNLIDSCQAHLSVHYSSNIELIHQIYTGVVIDSEPHLSRTCKTSVLFVPLAVRVQAPTKTLIHVRSSDEIQICLIPKLKKKKI